MAYDRKDHYYKKAKKEGKASRAVYKLLQLNERFHLIKKGDKVVDLGSAPGGWLEEISQIVGPKGRVIGIDILPLKISVPKNALFILGSIEDESNLAEIGRQLQGQTSAVVSDMAPNLSGIAFRDAYLSFELASIALEICKRFLKPGGSFVVKIFPGDELEGYRSELKKYFEKLSTVIPPATRKTSSELYLIAQKFRG